MCERGISLSLFFFFYEIVVVCRYSLKGEVWGWALFYGGIVGLAFGSAYYHLKPDDSRVMWDTLPVSIAILLHNSLCFLAIFSLCFCGKKCMKGK